MLFVLQGKYKGRGLLLPPRGVVRPMGQRMREAVFNILRHRYECVWSECVVADVFAGSGSLGIEALSRGAKSVFFIEKNRDVLHNYTMKNIKSDPNAVVMQCSALQKYTLPELLDVAFVDPPFQQDMVDKALEVLIPWMKPHSLIVVQQEKATPFTCPKGWSVGSERIYSYKYLRILTSQHFSS